MRHYIECFGRESNIDKYSAKLVLSFLRYCTERGILHIIRPAKVLDSYLRSIEAPDISRATALASMWREEATKEIEKRCQTMQWHDTTTRLDSTRLTTNTAFIDSGYAATLVVVDKHHIHFLDSVLPICSYRMEPNCNGMATADGIGMLSDKWRMPRDLASQCRSFLSDPAIRCSRQFG